MTALAAPELELDPLDFELPEELLAEDPPEARGLARDEVRLLVASRTDPRLTDARFRDLAGFLEPGDLVVVNTSATLPAAIGAADGRLVHLSTKLPGGLWLVELRCPAARGSLPLSDGRPGERLELEGGASVELLAPFPAGSDLRGARLWVAILEHPGYLLAWLGGNGRPIRYGRAERAWPLSAYQTIFAATPGSAEMPSAGRPFTGDTLAALARAGVGVAPVLLHTGVSSQEAGEPPFPEQFDVPAATARRVNDAHAAGGRVIAVGTTVTRALETTADELGRAHPGGGWTELVLSPKRQARVVDGILTGWHAPRASHLALLEAVAGRAVLERSYAAAVARGYRWHEFGDLHLILP